jgi:protein-tyrosine phosphatase
MPMNTVPESALAGVLDFHSHILPEVDDGSQSVDESILMINALAEQGIDRIVATPHFYANDESVSEFLVRRQKAYNEFNTLKYLEEISYV